MAQSDSQRSCFYYLLCYGSIFVILVSTSVMLIPDKIKPVAYTLPPKPSMIGPLSPNEELKKTNIVLKSMNGPESMVFFEGYLYTGTSDGKIMKISRKKEVSVLTQFGSGKTFSSRGRPLGLRLDPSKTFLFVADAYLGIFKVNLKTGKHQKIFPVNDNYNQTFLDDLDFLPNGDLIVSEATNQYAYDALIFDFLESRGNGRLLRINTKNGEFEVIKEGLCFPNGVQSDITDVNAVLVAETQRNRILRIFVDGPRKGEFEIFSDLPGTPDNIRLSENKDGYWIALGEIRTQEFDGEFHQLSQWPLVRGLVSKVFSAQTIMKLALRKRYSMIVKVDLNGKLVHSLHDPSGDRLPLSTEVHEYSGSLYLGNFDSNGLAFIDRQCVKDDKRKNTCFFN